MVFAVTCRSLQRTVSIPPDMARRTALLLPLLGLALTAALPADPLRDTIISEARAIDPARLAFDRTTTSVRQGGGSTTRTVLVERWDGRNWSLVSVNGRPPTDKERGEARGRSVQVPGYHRLAQIVGGAAERTTDAQGRTVLKIPALPAGSVKTNDNDISAHMQAEAVIATHNGRPWVQQLRVTAKESFKLNLLIKVTAFEQVSDYRLDPTGQPRLVSQTADSRGSMFGYSGGQKSESIYAYR